MTSTNIHPKPQITNTELARCRIRTYCITAFKGMRNVPNKNAGHFGVPKKFSGHGDFFKNGTVPEKMGQIGTLVKYQTF